MIVISNILMSTILRHYEGLFCVGGARYQTCILNKFCYLNVFELHFFYRYELKDDSKYLILNSV